MRLSVLVRFAASYGCVAVLSSISEAAAVIEGHVVDVNERRSSAWPFPYWPSTETRIFKSGTRLATRRARIDESLPQPLELLLEHRASVRGDALEHAHARLERRDLCVSAGQGRVQRPISGVSYESRCGGFALPAEGCNVPKQRGDSFHHAAFD